MNKILHTTLLAGAMTLMNFNVHAGPAIDSGKILKPAVKTPFVGKQISLPACPDPAANLQIRNIVRNSNGSFNFYLVAQVQNRGQGKYQSDPNQQGLALYESAGRNPLHYATFGNLNAGQAYSFTRRVTNYWQSAEFFTGYRVSISYDPDILLDSNTHNDDCNPRNNTAVLTQEQINTRLAAAYPATHTR